MFTTFTRNNRKPLHCARMCKPENVQVVGFQSVDVHMDANHARHDSPNCNRHFNEPSTIGLHSKRLQSNHFYILWCLVWPGLPADIAHLMNDFHRSFNASLIVIRFNYNRKLPFSSSPTKAENGINRVWLQCSVNHAEILFSLFSLCPKVDAERSIAQFCFHAFDIITLTNSRSRVIAFRKMSHDCVNKCQSQKGMKKSLSLHTLPLWSGVRWLGSLTLCENRRLATGTVNKNLE